jgi:hypothetical protein
VSDVEFVDIDQVAADLVAMWSRPWWAFWRRRPTHAEMVQKLRLALTGEQAPIRSYGFRIG